MIDIPAPPSSAPPAPLRNRRDGFTRWTRRCSGFLLLGMAALGAPARVAGAGVLTWGPVLDFEVREDELPGVIAKEHGWVARISPQVSLVRAGTNSTLELSGLRSFDSHREFTGPERAGDAATLRFRTEPSPFSKLETNASYLSTRDPLGHGALGPATFSESAIASGDSRLELWRVAGEYVVRSHTYQSGQSSEGLAQTWELAAFPFRKPDTRGVVGWHGRDLQIDGKPVLTTQGVTVGYRRTHFEGLSSELAVGGASTRDRVRGTNSWDLAVIAGASADRGTVRLPFDVRCRLARDVATTGFVEGSLSGNRRTVAARWEQNLGAEGGLFRDPTLSRYMTVEVRDTLGRFAVRLEGSLGRTQSQFQSDLWLRTHRAWASLSRRVLPWLAAGVDYSYVNQDATSSVPSWVFRRSRVGLRLTMGAL